MAQAMGIMPKFMNLLFIVNPTAGRGRASALESIKLIENFCNHKNIEFRIKKTHYRGHATEIAKKAVDSESTYDAVISVGGDGTLLEVANGIVGSNLLLGVLPAGTGNDFARAIGIPLSVKGALSFLTKKRDRLIDVGKLNNLFFINVASVGLDAEIARDIPKFKKFVPGGFSYFLAALVKFFTYRFKELTLIIDGEKIHEKIILVAIANGTHYGGGMKVNPEGLLGDGYLDVIVVNSLPRYKIPFLLLKFVKGKHLDIPYVNTYRCKEIVIDSQDKLVINADGEILGNTPATFSVNPLSLKVIGG